MGVIRSKVAVDTSYTSVPNEFARDKRLSRRARGLLVEIMSHRVGWRVTVKSLTAGGPEGRDAIASALRELREAGYLTVDQDRGGRGRYQEVEYELRNPHTSDSDDETAPTANGFTAYGLSGTGESAPKKKRQEEDQVLRTPSDNSGSTAGVLSDPSRKNIADAMRAVDSKTEIDVRSLIEAEITHLSGLDKTTQQMRIGLWIGLRSRANTLDTDDLANDERLQGLLAAHGYDAGLRAETGARS